MTIHKAYQTNIVLALGFYIIAYLFESKYLYLLPIVVLVLTVLHEGVALFIAKYWMKLGELMGKISGSIILTILFCVILVPTAFLQKLFTKKERYSTSNWKETNYSIDKESFERAW